MRQKGHIFVATELSFQNSSSVAFPHCRPQTDLPQTLPKSFSNLIHGQVFMTIVELGEQHTIKLHCLHPFSSQLFSLLTHTQFKEPFSTLVSTPKFFNYFLNFFPVLYQCKISIRVLQIKNQHKSSRTDSCVKSGTG